MSIERCEKCRKHVDMDFGGGEYFQCLPPKEYVFLCDRCAENEYIDREESNETELSAR